jgi:soluble lytic murein transglycosylase-like protein
MKMNYALIIVFVALFLFFVVKGYAAKKKSSFEVYLDKQGFIKITNVKNLYEELYNRFAEQIISIINSYDLKITVTQALAMIRQESSDLFKRKENSDVIGDDGKSIGYTQITKYAVADFNNRYNKDYSLNDRTNENKNLEIGLGYLNLCYESAVNSGASNPVKLAYKKYNGGNDETETSLNLMAASYSNSVMNHLKEFQKIEIG